MQRLSYGIFLAFSRLITLLPYRAMFVFADLLYGILYYLIGYRKQVIDRNLQAAFPEKSPEERYRIRKKFYRHLSDLFIETMAMYYATPEQMKKRFRLVNAECFRQMHARYQQVLLVLGHCNNWEYLISAAYHIPVNCAIAYKPLSNPYFDKFYKTLRSKFGTTPFPMQQTLRKLLQDKKAGKSVMYALVADQRPTKRESHIRASFLNQPTRVFFGPEKIARRFNLPVIYVDTYKIRRGHYAIEAKIITENPGDMGEYEITKRYFEYLTQSIRREPAHWLWSHKRWKKEKQAAEDIVFEV